MPRRKHQCQAVLEWLRSGWPLTQDTATKQLGIMRLASRVDNLRQRGYDIETRMIPVPSRWNVDGARTGTKVAEYRLRKDIPGPSYWELPRKRPGRRPDRPQENAPAQVPASAPTPPPALSAAPDLAGRVKEEQAGLFL